MRTHHRLLGYVFGLVCLCLPLMARGQSTGFTYQGRLDDAGVPANGAFDLRFTLFGAVSGGTAISGVVCADDVQVVDGLFTVILPLTIPPSGGDAFLEVQVRPGAAGTCADAAGFTALAPRANITPVPKAVFASAVSATAPALRGALRFNPDSNQFEGFTGAYWVPLTTGAPITPANTQTFSTVGTTSFAVPAGVFHLGVDIWAGGGAGGARGAGGTAPAACTNSITGNWSGGGGGGSAGTYARAVLDVTPGETLTVTVGGGGAPTATVGGTGGNSTVNRGAAVQLRAYGGRGGARGLTHTTMPASTFTCVRPTSGPGGASPAEAQFFAPGTFFVNHPGTVGGDGQGPACFLNNPPNGGTCFANRGFGAVDYPSSAPLPVLRSGDGGDGGDINGSNPTAGEQGLVRLFWN